MNVDEIVKKYSKNKNHLLHTKFLALTLFQKLKPIFRELEKYNNEADLKLLECGALLHDIGINFEDKFNLSHHKAGAKFILYNKPDEIDEKDIKVLACLIRYHRKSLPDKKHKLYNSLNDEDKRKTDCLASIIRLADSMDNRHLGLVEDFITEYDFSGKILTFEFPPNIMIDEELVNGMVRKTDFLEKVFSVEVKFKRG